ncbi:MAG: ABC transporter permease, partial [Myxococcaceae bacterium]
LRGSGSMRPRARRLRRVLVAVDVGLALVLLCAASLLLRSFVEALGVDPGFRANGVLTLQAVVPTPSGTPHDQAEARYRRYVDGAVKALVALPGVESAGAISALPLSANRSDRLFTVDGRTPRSGDELLDEQYRAVAPGFFETLRIPLLQGRTIQDSDGENAPRAVVVNQSFARKIFPRGDALGQRISLSSPATDWATVVGVVGDVRELGLDEPVLPIMYFPHAQQPTDGMTYVVRSAAPFAQLRRSTEAALEAVDPGIPVFGVGPLESLLTASVAARRFSLVLVATFAVLALVLAAVGLYGVVAYSVRQRTKEIGVRMAIGADAGRIARLVVGESARMVGAGLAAGLVAALVAARVLAGFLYGVGPADPLALVAAAAMLAIAAVLATVLPVRRATQVDPVIALGAE